MLQAALPEILDAIDRETYNVWSTELQAAGVPQPLAANVAGMPSMISVFDVIEAARTSEREPDEVMILYFRLGSRLDLNWLRDRIIGLPRTNLGGAGACSSAR
jgi:glutamate dehydrogenase